MTRAPEGYRPSDLITAPVIVALLIVTAVLGRHELMPHDLCRQLKRAKKVAAGKEGAS